VWLEGLGKFRFVAQRLKQLRYRLPSLKGNHNKYWVGGGRENKNKTFAM
jgi:hypothetical protein